MTPADLYNHGLENGPSAEFDALIVVHCLGQPSEWKYAPATTTGKLNITDAMAFAREMLSDWKDAIAHIPDDTDIFSDDELAFTITMATLKAMENER